MVVSVPARAALAGNPSDMHGGAVLAIPVRAFAATAKSSKEASDEELVRAALVRAGSDARLEVTTTIPRAVGLAGSSAIVIATLRAAGVELEAMDLAELALSIERDDLGIAAGLQDRAVQAFDAPVLVDVTATPVVRVLEPAAPLEFVVAWRADAASDSGDYHRGRQPSPAGIATLARTARAAADAFSAGDAGALSELMGFSAELRAEVAPLPPAHEELADAVRAAGLSPNSTGSGGAVVAVVTERANLERLQVPFVTQAF
jgi:glucuronokinase